MSEFLHTASYEVEPREEWMKQQSLDVMRKQEQHLKYPPQRLTYSNGARRISEYDRLYLPNGKWQAASENDLPITGQMINEFYQKGYALDYENRPLHPWINDLLQDDIGVVTGRGFYRRWGANYTADAFVFRHDQAEPQVLLVLRNDGHWAAPGGFVEPGEPADKAALREAGEEALIDISALEPVLIPVYEGVVADPRTTANAWPETSAYAVHLTPHDTANLPTGTFAGDPEEVKMAGWFTLEQAAQLTMFGSHQQMLALASQTL